MFKKTWHYVVAIVAALAVIGVISFFATLSSYKTEGVRLEQDLNAQYKSNQVELSAFISGFYETMGIADTKSEKLDELLSNALQARGGNTSDSDQNLVNAVVEAYPDLSGLDAYDRVMDYVTGGRESFKQKQNVLLDKISKYRTWSDSGLIKPMMINLALGGTPSDRLQVEVEGNTLYGEAALNKMGQMVLTTEAVEAYETGTMDPLIKPEG